MKKTFSTKNWKKVSVFVFVKNRVQFKTSKLFASQLAFIFKFLIVRIEKIEFRTLSCSHHIEVLLHLRPSGQSLQYHIKTIFKNWARCSSRIFKTDHGVQLLTLESDYSEAHLVFCVCLTFETDDAENIVFLDRFLNVKITTFFWSRFT